MDKLEKLINYFELEEGYDKEEIIADILGEIKQIKGHSADEIGLVRDFQGLGILQDFADEFYDAVITGVVNVAKSFREP